LNAEQFEILKDVRGSGPITEDQHRRFWMLFSDSERKAWIEAEQNGASKSVLFSRMEEWAFWRSMYESQRAGKPIKISELEQARKVGLAAASIEGAKQSLDAFYREQDDWLDPVWLNSPEFQWRDPSQLFMRANNLEVNGRRLQLILDSEWHPAIRQWFYPPMRLSISWEYPWWLQQLGMFCDVRCKTWFFSQPVSETGSLKLFLFGEINSEWDWSDSNAINAGVVQAGDTSYRFDVISQVSEQAEWQGYRSSIYRSAVRGYDGKSYRVTRIVPDPRRGAAWVLVAVSYASEEEANRLFDQLDGAVILK
jgi:hypothetical protein